MRCDEQSSQGVRLFADFVDRQFCRHGENNLLHFDNLVVCVDDRLVTENLRLVDAFYQTVAYPLPHGKRLLGSVENGEQMHFFSRADFKAVKSRYAGAAAALCESRCISCAVVVGYYDSVDAFFACLERYRARRHFKRGAGRKT